MKIIYHKINDRTGLVACGRDPQEVPLTTEWKRTSCVACREHIDDYRLFSAKRRVLKDDSAKKYEVRRREVERASHPAIEKSLDVDFGKEVRPKLSFGSIRNFSRMGGHCVDLGRDPGSVVFGMGKKRSSRQD